MILALFSYKTKPGERDDFIRAAQAIDLLGNTRREPGNITYEYYLPIEDPDVVLCLERWESAEAFAAHRGTDHVVKFQDVKAQFVTDVTPCIYDAVPRE
ncbi:MAG: antibiotic biosynthesis monooxygenase [Clostridiales Family XIII bacterium]|jgi:quinol monooxygenase YgiN|nr:antibiotic biosynthesis monooxygenase [Clostridiales Family XIII bacterium]